MLFCFRLNKNDKEKGFQNNNDKNMMVNNLYYLICVYLIFTQQIVT